MAEVAYSIRCQSFLDTIPGLLGEDARVHELAIQVSRSSRTVASWRERAGSTSLAMWELELSFFRGIATRGTHAGWRGGCAFAEYPGHTA